MSEQTVIIGSGQAGVTLASALRERGYEGRIRLIGAERHLPYQKPPLSKDFMASADQPPQPLRPADFYRDNDIELELGQVVSRIDLASRTIAFEQGGALRFSKLAIATGGRPRRLDGSGISGVYTLRSLDDAEILRERVARESHVVIIGGGFIGLELAATLSACGHEVLVIEGASRLMERAVSSAVSEYYRRVHEAWGVRFLFDERPVRFVRKAGRLDGLITSSGRRIAASTVIVGAGLEPDCGLAEAAGLECHDGIEVDARLCAGGVGWVTAIGDCARFPQYHTGTRLRVESVQNATDQARCAAATLTGSGAPYVALPWFWSSQRDQRLQIAGIAAGADWEVVRGSPDQGRFSVFRYRGHQLVAVDSVNQPAEHMVARKLIARGVLAEPVAVERPDFDLKSLLES